MQQAKVYRNKVFVGILKKLSEKEYTFKYDTSYLLSDKAKAFGISFPLQKEEFVSDYLFAFFFNMLTEGSQKKLQCQSLRLDKDDAFSRLIKTAGWDTIGAVTVREIL